MDGRALVQGPPDAGTAAAPMPETLEAGTAGFSQRLLRTRCGDQIYIDEAYRLSG